MSKYRQSLHSTCKARETLNGQTKPMLSLLYMECRLPLVDGGRM